MLYSQYDSLKSGPHIGILACTHGNEPVGVRVFEYLPIFLEQYPLLQGRLSCVVVNQQAYESYLQAKKNNTDTMKWRFIDHNMNRIRNHEFIDTSYEYHRREQIKPLLDSFDIVLDIHSTSKPTESIGICDISLLQEAKQIFDTSEIRCDDMTQTGALIGYCIKQGKNAYALEAGSHEDPQGCEYAVRHVARLLSHYQIITPIHTPKRHSTPHIYHFLNEAHCQTDQFVYSQEFVDMTLLEPHGCIGIDGGQELRSPHNIPHYFGLATTNPRAGDGIGFFFERLG